MPQDVDIALQADIPQEGDGPFPLPSQRPPGEVAPPIPTELIHPELVVEAASSYYWQPTYYSFASLASIKKDDVGVKVAALQLNLSGVMTVDGVFGADTESAVKDWQTQHGLVSDGVAGAKTQRSLCIARADDARVVYDLPVGFLKGKLEQESNFFLAALSFHPSDWGYDIGALQWSIGPNGDPADQAHFQYGYNVSLTAKNAAATARAFHDHFRSEAGVTTKNWYGEAVQIGEKYRPSVFAWQLAALTWNWPAAAQNLALHGTVYNYAGGDDQYQQWIYDASGGRMTTARQWVVAYMSNATKYCRF